MSSAKRRSARRWTWPSATSLHILPIGAPTLRYSHVEQRGEGGLESTNRLGVAVAEVIEVVRDGFDLGEGVHGVEHDLALRSAVLQLWGELGGDLLAKQVTTLAEVGVNVGSGSGEVVSSSDDICIRPDSSDPGLDKCGDAVLKWSSAQIVDAEVLPLSLDEYESLGVVGFRGAVRSTIR
jgi:hypothetical protein